MIFESKYSLGQIVYLVTDPEQLPRMVAAVQFTADGGTVYTLGLANIYSQHYDIEICDRIDHGRKFGINSN